MVSPRSPKILKGGFFAASVLLATSIVGCTEKSTFTPLAPNLVSARLTEALNDLGENAFGATIQAGRTGALNPSPFPLYQEMVGRAGVFVMDWTSSANRVTITLHRTGGPVSFDNPTPPSDDCSIPNPLPPFGTGNPIGGALPRPLCPVVMSFTTNDKPKAVDFRDLPSGSYAVVLTNEGPGNETIRWFYFE